MYDPIRQYHALTPVRTEGVAAARLALGDDVVRAVDPRVAGALGVQREKAAAVAVEAAEELLCERVERLYRIRILAKSVSGCRPSSTRCRHRR